MTGLLETAGSAPNKQTHYAPIFIESFWAGLWTNRNILQSPGSLYESKYMGGRPGSMLGGLNCEVTVRNTVARRFGTSNFSTATYPTPPNTAFSFELLNGTIQVIVDCGGTGNLTLSAVTNSSGGTAVYTGTFAAGGSNAYAGMVFQITGFTNAANNGTYTCTASSLSTLTLANNIAVAESHAAVAASSGAVYYDQQNGLKTLLFGKQPGAGQTCFVGVAGILYSGDGASTWIYNPSNSNGTFVYGWGLVAPLSQPSVTITPSGAASVQFTANTVFSTMGLVFDAANNAAYQLNSVNASGTNTTQFGITGNGQPAWNQTPGGTTTDNTITWVNKGPIVAWTANTTFNNYTVGGTTTNPCAIYDPNTKAVYVNANPGQTSGVSGNSYPKFIAGVGQATHDGSVKWFYLGPGGIPSTWKPNTSYPKDGSVSNNEVVSTVCEPTGLQNGLPTNATIFLQSSGGGTSGAGGTSPFSASTNLAGTQTSDGDQIWLSLGSDQWAATTAVSGWSTSGTVFSAIKDPNSNWQVCTTTGTTGTVKPGTSFTLSAAGNASGGNTTYTGTFSPTLPVGAGNLTAVIAGFTNAANNGTFTIVSCSSTQLVVKNAGGVAETHAGTAIYNPWGIGYGAITSDGSAVWTCVGNAFAWTASQKWYLPVGGFQPPSISQPFGGASLIDSNADVEFVVNSGVSGGTAPSWSAIGKYTGSGSTLTLSQVAVSGQTVTYTGTGLSGLAGQSVLVAGFTNAGNNGVFSVLTAGSTTFTVALTSQVNETHAATVTNGLIFYNLEAFTGNSLAWSFGHSYSYSFKARSTTDFYSTPVNGVLPIPPGLTSALPFPSGSQTGDISSASPAFNIVGSDAGAVNTVSGLGSTNPAVDTIVIWRDADGGGAGQMFELTEIPAPQPIGGIAQPWSFQDFLPDTPTSKYPGLNPLEPAPINGVNNPAPSNALPQAYNFERIWCATGQQIIFSGGPDTLVGNPNSAFNAADEFPFLSNVIRAVKTTQGLVTFTSNSIEIILGGPLTASFYSVTAAPGIGLGNYNALTGYAGEIFFLDTTGSMRVLSPNLSISSFGFSVADQLAQLNPKTAYVTFHDGGTTDQAIYVGTGSTALNGKNGYFRCNPRQIPGGLNGPEPVWSPFAAPATGGFQMLQSVEVSPGVKELLIGSTTAAHTISERNTSVYTDSGTPFDANFQVGALLLAHRGEIAALKFMEVDTASVTTSATMTLSYLLNDLSGTYTNFTSSAAHFDPPQVFGAVLPGPTAYNPLRYYFASNAQIAVCVHMNFGIDFGTSGNADEIFNATIFGRVVKRY